MKTWGLLLGVLLAVAALLLGAGQRGVFAGKPPQDLGVRDGRLKPPSPTPNSVSSQAGGYADHPQRREAHIAPLSYTGDAKASLDAPRWLLVDVQVLQKIPTITLPALRDRPELAELLVLKKGNRLSITPVEAGHWQSISKLADNPAPGHA